MFHTLFGGGFGCAAEEYGDGNWPDASGDWSDDGSNLLNLVEDDIADDRTSTFGVSDGIDPDINHDGTGFDVLRADQTGPANGYHEKVRSASVPSKI